MDTLTMFVDSMAKERRRHNEVIPISRVEFTVGKVADFVRYIFTFQDAASIHGTKCRSQLVLHDAQAIEGRRPYCAALLVLVEIDFCLELMHRFDKNRVYGFLAGH